MIGRPRRTNTDLPQRLKVRVNKSGKHRFYYRLRGGGKIPLGTDRSAALEKWAQLETKGTLLVADAVPSLIDRYRREVLGSKKPKTQEQYEVRGGTRSIGRGIRYGAVVADQATACKTVFGSPQRENRRQS